MMMSEPQPRLHRRQLLRASRCRRATRCTPSLHYYILTFQLKPRVFIVSSHHVLACVGRLMLMLLGCILLKQSDQVYACNSNRSLISNTDRVTGKTKEVTSATSRLEKQWLWHHPRVFPSNKTQSLTSERAYVIMRLTGTPLLLTTSVCLAFALICHVLAMATSFWLQSTSAADGTFLNIGLWVACFSDYQHTHQHLPRQYDGCHTLYSDYYASIRDWLIPS